MANFHIYDTLLHYKTGSNEDIILLPKTKYENVFGAPCVISSEDGSIPGAPFFLFQNDTVELDSSEVTSLIGIDLEIR